MEVQPTKQPVASVHSLWHLLIIFSVALTAGAVLFWVWSEAAAEIDTSVESNLKVQLTVPPPAPVVKRDKTPQQVVKGVYLTASSANNPGKLDEIIKLIDATELNAVVIDIKDYTGYVLYDSKVPLVEELGTKKAILHDVPDIIKKLHEHHIYVIARQTVFQDPILAQKKPEWSIKNKNGGLWRDNKGLSWVDASREEVWKYNADIAKEAAALGFDEINFDYIRFPSDGPIRLMNYAASPKKKYEVMHDFYSYLSDAMKDEPVWISFDMFGLVMDSKGTNDLGIGQRLIDAVDNADYICPMMYASHYATGYAGLANPATNPALVLQTGFKRGLPEFASTRAKLRPWIQAFNMGAIYDGTKIRQQIDMVEKNTNAGWLMWNASNRYTSAGLRDE